MWGVLSDGSVRMARQRRNTELIPKAAPNDATLPGARPRSATGRGQQPAKSLAEYIKGSAPRIQVQEPPVHTWPQTTEAFKKQSGNVWRCCAHRPLLAATRSDSSCAAPEGWYPTACNRRH